MILVRKTTVFNIYRIQAQLSNLVLNPHS